MIRVFILSIVAVSLFNLQVIGEEKIPLEPALRYGKLENGMTYYIRHNEEPKERVSFYFAQNVGAILENDDQNGLAHFLEHMAFNGTENFEGKGIIELLERHGVEFGANINAYTSQDETVYNILRVPTNEEGLIDSCLLILYDWSNGLLLTDEEIDAERGVIIEEWRTRRNSRFRMNAKRDKALYHGSKYAKRDVIGDLDVIKNFDYQTLRDFYHEWYRPDLQAVIIVGDIDVDETEKKVKKLFSKIPPVPNAKERKDYDIPNNKEPLYAIASDKEASNNMISFMYKIPSVADKKDVGYLKHRHIRNLFNRMIGARVKEVLEKPNPPFMYADARISSFIPKKNLAVFLAAHRENGWEQAARGIATVVEKARDFGFTQGELERAVNNVISELEDSYAKRDKKQSVMYAIEYKMHFLDEYPIPGIKYKLDFAKEFLPTVTLNRVNALAQNFLSDENLVIVASGPEKEGLTYPSKEEILAVIDEVKNAELEPYVDSFVDKPLIEKEPDAGKIVARKQINAGYLEATELELSNGINVLYRYSDLEKETVICNAHSWGGRSMVSEENLGNAFVLSDFIRGYGLGDFSSTDLNKKLTGKVVSSSFYMDDLAEGVYGRANPKDLETMFQLIHLRFTNPRFNKDDYQSIHQKVKENLENMKNNVGKAFQDSVSLVMAGYHPRSLTWGDELFNTVSYEGLKNVYLDRFSNASDFVFSFSGDFEVEKLEHLIEKYIASIPAVKSEKERYIDHGISSPQKDVYKYFERELETTKSTVYINLHNKKYSFNTENNLYARIIARLLKKRYLEEIREKEGGSYFVNAYTKTIKHPNEEIQLIIQFDCEPSNTVKLKKIALEEIQQLIKGNVSEEDLEKVKNSFIKSEKEQINTLNYWHSMLYYYTYDGRTRPTYDDYRDFVNSISSESVIKMARKFFKNAVKVEVIMTDK